MLGDKSKAASKSISFAVVSSSYLFLASLLRVNPHQLSLVFHALIMGTNSSDLRNNISTITHRLYNQNITKKNITNHVI